MLSIRGCNVGINYFYGYCTITHVGVQVDLPESSIDSLPEEQEPLTLTINLKEKFLSGIQSRV